MDLPLSGRRADAPKREASRATAAPRSSSAPNRWRGPASTLDAIGGAGLKAGDGLVSAFTLAGKSGRRGARRRRSGLASRGGHARRTPAVRLGSEEPDDRQDRRRCEAVSRREGRHRSVGSRARRSYVRGRGRRRRAPRRRRCRWPTAATRQGAGRAESVQGDRQRATRSAPLSYANVRARADPAARAGLRRRRRSICRPRLLRAAAAVAAARAPARRRREGELRSLHRSTRTTARSADSDNNLIPDRVDVLLSADGDGTDGVIDLAARLGLESTGIVAADREAAEGDHRARQRADARARSARRIRSSSS